MIDAIVEQSIIIVLLLLLFLLLLLLLILVKIFIIIFSLNCWNYQIEKLNSHNNYPMNQYNKIININTHARPYKTHRGSPLRVIIKLA